MGGRLLSFSWLAGAPSIDVPRARCLGPLPLASVGRAGVLSRLAASPRLALLALAVVCIAAFLPGFFTLPVIDRDEPRYAQASRQMLESGPPWRDLSGWVVPMVQDVPRLNKPPLAYWAQAASVALLTGGDPARDAIWMYRVPTLLAAAVAVWLTWVLGRRLFDDRTALLGAALLAICPLVAWEAHRARTDMMLLAVTLAALLALWEVWRAERLSWRWPLLFWGAIGLGVLTKGPVTPLVAGLTAMALAMAARDARWMRRLRPVAGLALVAAIILPWGLLVVGEVGWSRYLAIITDETIGRSLEPKDGHWGPPGYHLALLPVAFWPGTLFIVAGLALAVRGGLARRPIDPPPSRSMAARVAHWARSAAAPRPADPAPLFCLAWIVPSWVAFELITTKLPHYPMPLYPALALLSARATIGAADSAGAPLRSALARLNLGVWLVVGAALGCLLPIVFMFGAVAELPVALAPPVAATACALATPLFLTLAVRAWNAGRPLRALAAGAAGQLVAMALVVGIVMPEGDSLWVSQRLAAGLRAHDPHRRRPLAVVGYPEASIVFVTRGRVERLEPGQVEAWLASNPDGLLWADRRLWPAAPPGARPAAAPPGWGAVSTAAGYNYSQGLLQVLHLYSRTPAWNTLPAPPDSSSSTSPTG